MILENESLSREQIFTEGELEQLAYDAEESFLPGAQYRLLLALNQVAKTHPELEINREMAEKLITPSREASLTLPVDFKGKTYLCYAARAHFDDGQEPPEGHIRKGGIRYLETDGIERDSRVAISNPEGALALMEEDVGALGLEMLAKNAGAAFPDLMKATDIPELVSVLKELDVIGGAKGVIVGPRNPHLPDHNEFIAEALRQYGYVFTKEGLIGWDRDVPAGDIGTTGTVNGKSVMDFLVEGHHEALHDMITNLPLHKVQAVVTGKSLEYGGNPARATATGFGTVEALKVWAEERGRELRGLKVVFDGAGNAAGPAAKRLIQEGIKVLGMTDTRSVIYCPDGLTEEDIDTIAKIKEKRGSLADFVQQTESRVKVISRDLEEAKKKLWQESQMDVLFASSAERVINMQNVNSLPDGCLIVDGANGPVTPLAEKHLIEKNIDHLTGSFANAGGVMCSLIEWAANVAGIKVTAEQAEEAIRFVIRRNFEEMDRLVKAGVVKSLTEAFYFMAMERFVRKMKESNSIALTV